MLKIRHLKGELWLDGDGFVGVRVGTPLEAIEFASKLTTKSVQLILKEKADRSNRANTSRKAGEADRGEASSVSQGSGPPTQ
jgi:hypothetical protein